MATHCSVLAQTTTWTEEPGGLHTVHGVSKSQTRLSTPYFPVPASDFHCLYSIKRHLPLGRRAMANLDSVLKSRDITLPTKVNKVKINISHHVWMWKLDLKEGWASKNWCFPTAVLEKTLDSHLGCKEIKPVNFNGNQPWIFIGRTDVEAVAPVLWPPGAKNCLSGKDPDAGKDWKQEKELTDEMVWWHHWLNGHEFEQTIEDGEGQESLACCIPWGHKESNAIEWLTRTEPNYWLLYYYS